MTHADVIRAWKDEDYRLSLSETERASLPEHPAGMIELKEDQMGNVIGGTGRACNYTSGLNCYTRFGTCTC